MTEAEEITVDVVTVEETIFEVVEITKLEEALEETVEEALEESLDEIDDDDEEIADEEEEGDALDDHAEELEELGVGAA